MDTFDELRVAVSDLFRDEEIGPHHVSLELLNDFQKDVSDFLKGSNRELDPSEVKISVEQGSFAIRAFGLLAATTLWSDVNTLQSAQTLGGVDSKRAAVILRWQEYAKSNPHRRYAVKDVKGNDLFVIDAHSTYKINEEVWVHVEKYLSGKIVDMGGKIKANVHLELESGATMKISSTQDLLAEVEQNRLYKKALLYVAGEENLATGEVRNLSLLNFSDITPRFDEEEFNRMVEAGTEAWSDVTDASEWLENLRGNRA